jgi:hypothetical protein
MSGITVTQLIQGPGTFYLGAQYTSAYTTTAEPADAAVNTTPQSSAWSDVGGTQDGVTIEVAREFSELEVDQVVDIPDRRLTKREFSLSTNMAEPTLENFAKAQNESAPTSAAGRKTYEPVNTSAASQPTYCAVLFDGYAPGQFRRRIIGRRMLSVDPTTFAYKKDAQTVFNVKWAGHYVSESIAPYKIIDQTA